MKTLLKNSGSAALLVLLLAASACREAPPPPDRAPETTRAVAVLHPTEGNTVSGVVSFTREGNGVRVNASLRGLNPGSHGFHIHEYGDCSAADGTSAGGHYNPAGSPHGAPDNPPDARHVGDLGNLDDWSYDRVDTVLTLNGPTSIIGRAVIVHEGADDLTTQPTGAAGARLACGVIGYAQ